MKNLYKTKPIFIGILLVLLSSCEKDYFPQPPKPRVPKETLTLEAAFVNTPPVAIADAYWKNSDFLKVPVINLNKSMLYPEGFLNMTGTYTGLSSFNKGSDPNVVMKAAYDNSKLYIYVEWVDSDLSPELQTSILNGPADPLKSDSAKGWTSQGNSDKVALAFEIANASGAAGSFSEKGCAASCHLNKMQPATGSVDIWNWDLAVSEPLGYARDMFTESLKGLLNDAGNDMVIRNKTNPGNPRSAPAYEWDGTEQSYKRPDGKTTNLDPAFFLLNKIPFTGNLKKGDEAYHHVYYGCNHCHGDNGEGVGAFGEATAFASSGFSGKWSRAGIKNFSGEAEHEGKTYWRQVPPDTYDDLIAYIKGLGGLPGFYLVPPTLSSANIWSVSNVTRSKINILGSHTIYKVIFIRDLTTGNTDDAQFTKPAGKSYPFGIALMDNDGINHIGSLKQILTFK